MRPEQAEHVFGDLVLKPFFLCGSGSCSIRSVGVGVPTGERLQMGQPRPVTEDRCPSQGANLSPEQRTGFSG